MTHMLREYFRGIGGKQTISWAFFDFANSSYALLIGSFVFPVFYKEVIAGPAKGDFYWGLVISISIFIGGLLAPIIGAVADYDRRGKRKFVVFSLISMAATTLLFYSGPGTIIYASAVFVVANVFFELAVVLYDSFLARVSTPETAGRVSGFAWGLGYIGGLVAMLALNPLFAGGYQGDLLTRYKLTFPLTALFFFIFALPSFIYLKDTIGVAASSRSVFRKVRMGVAKIFTTVKNIRHYKTVALFLLGFFFMNDALVTVFSFAPIYVRSTLGMSFGEVTMLLFLVQLLAFPSAAVIGSFSDRIGRKKILLVTVSLWCLIVILMAVAHGRTAIYIALFLAALTMGSSQAVARAWLNQLVPEEKRFEIFGFNGFAGKLSATVGPVLFGSVSVFSGSQRWAMLSILPFFLAALWIFSRVSEHLTSNAPGN